MVVEASGRATRGAVPRQGRCGRRRISGDRAATPRIHVRSSVRNAARESCLATQQAREEQMSEVTMVAAIAMALGRAMQDDERVVVLGEDVAKNGGVFRATD